MFFIMIYEARAHSKEKAYQHITGYRGYKLWRIRETDKDVPESAEEQEASQWLQIGLQYRSNNAGDGPSHEDDINIEKVKLLTPSSQLNDIYLERWKKNSNMRILEPKVKQQR